MVSLAKKYENKPFILITSHAQNVDKETVVAFVKSQKVAADSPNFSLTSFGRHEADDGRGIPRCMVFDHTGKIAFKGHPGQIDGTVANLLSKVPTFYLGELKYTSSSVSAIAKAVEERNSLGKNLGKLEKIVAESEDETEKADADNLKSRLEEFFSSAQERLVEKLNTDPVTALKDLKALSKELKGSTLGTTIDTLYNEKRKDPAVKASIPLGKKLANYKREYDKLLKEGRLPMSKQSQRDTIVKKLTKLADANPELPITAAIREFVDSIK